MAETLTNAHGSLLEAASFAARAHRGQVRKDGATPYVSHVFRVCLVLRDIFGFDDRRMLIACLLHDTVEDTTTDFDDLKEKFGHEIAQWVAYLSKDKRLEDKEREQAYIKQLSEAPWQVRGCKLADMFDNLMDTRTLAPEKRQHVVERAASYLKCMHNAADEQLRRAVQMVEQLLAEVRGRS